MRKFLANATSETIVNELPSIIYPISTPNTSMPNPEVSIFNSPLSDFESKSDDLVVHGVFGDDPLPFGLELVDGICLFI